MDLTLFNSVYNPDTERTEYKRTYLYNVNWQASKKISEDGKGVLSYDLINCFIPFSVTSSDNKIYKTPGEFIKLASEDIDKFFTFKKGDFIVKGLIDIDLNKLNRGESIAQLKNYYDIGAIISVETNDFGSKYLQHWEIGAK